MGRYTDTIINMMVTPREKAIQIMESAIIHERLELNYLEALGNMGVTIERVPTDCYEIIEAVTGISAIDDSLDCNMWVSDFITGWICDEESTAHEAATKIYDAIKEARKVGKICQN